MITNSEDKNLSNGPLGLPTLSISRMLRLKEKNKLPNLFYLGGLCFQMDSIWVLSAGTESWTLIDPLIDCQPLQKNWTLIQVSSEKLNWDKKIIYDAKFIEEGPAPHGSIRRFLDPGFKIENSNRWFDFKQEVGNFFRQEGLVPVETPTLVSCPGMEPTLDPMAVSVQLNGQKWSSFLPTSPELHLKKFIAAHKCDGFEIKTCFRDGELSPIHEPEFTMLEWYRSFADLNQIQTDINELTSHLIHALGLDLSVGPLIKIELPQLFKDLTGINLTPKTSDEELRFWCDKWGYYTKKEDSFDDLFFHIFLNKIDPWLNDQKEPLLLALYPPSQSALAKLTSEGWADRFEWYWQGLELGNAFNELTDPQEQKSRFLKDNLEKEKRNKTPLPVDTEFLEALEFGMPPSAGIAVGLERLFLAMSGENSIKDLKAFSWNWKSQKI